LLSARHSSETLKSASSPASSIPNTSSSNKVPIRE
jgi:hypothetical protein